jgi:flavodoxin
MKDLVVFYSWTGNTRVVASELAAKTGADLKEIEEVKPRKKIIGFITGAFQAVTGRKSKIKPLDFNPDEYDRLFIGSPVWASHNAPAINSFLSVAGLKGKKVYLFFTLADDKPPVTAIASLTKKIAEQGGEVIDTLAVRTEMNKTLTPEKVSPKVTEWLNGKVNVGK